MTWKIRMYAGIGEYLRSRGVDAVTVTDFEEHVSVSGPYGCDTCGPDYDTDFSLTIVYNDSQNKRHEYFYDGSFIEFLNNIT